MVNRLLSVIEQLADEFRSLAEQVPAAIFRCDRSGTVSFHNELWESLCPADPDAQRLHDLIHPAHHDELDEELMRLDRRYARPDQRKRREV